MAVRFRMDFGKPPHIRKAVECRRCGTEHNVPKENVPPHRRRVNAWRGCRNDSLWAHRPYVNLPPGLCLGQKRIL